MIKPLFSKRWLLTTLLVFVGVLVMVRLGIWQLDRLEQRRAFNQRVEEQINLPALDLNAAAGDENLAAMEYRKVSVEGEFTYSEEIALRNQYWGNQWGVHLITPLKIKDSDQVVLVDRGWIPAEAFESGDWSQFQDPGVVRLEGIIRRSQSKADFGSRADELPTTQGERLRAWNFVNIPLIQTQSALNLLPIYIQQAPGDNSSLPYRALEEIELTEGPHMGYALQWFTFAAILGLGYPFFVRRREKQKGSRSISPDSPALSGEELNHSLQP